MTDAYRDEIARLTRALAAGAVDDLLPALADGATDADVRLYARGNRAQRRTLLRAQLDFLAGAIHDLDDRLGAYLRAGPLAAGDSVRMDLARFLTGLVNAGDLTAEQLDHVACQRARVAVAAAAERDRAARRRFHQQWLATDPEAVLTPAARLVIHLNPIRAAARFATAALVGEGVPLPADALFFAAAGEYRTALLEPHGRALVEELASWGPCALDAWASGSRAGTRDEIGRLCRSLARMGLVAFDPAG